MILILRLSICDVTFKSFIDHVVSTLHVPGRRERFVMIFFIIYGLNILIKFQVSEWETTKWRPKWYQRGVHPRSWWSHRGMSCYCTQIGRSISRFCIESSKNIFHPSEQLGWGRGQLWWHEPPRRAIERNLCLWIWETLCYSTESHYSLY